MGTPYVAPGPVPQGAPGSLADALEFGQFAVQALKEGNKDKAMQFFERAMQSLR